MNFAKYRLQLSTEKKYSSKYEYKYEYEYSIPVKVYFNELEEVSKNLPINWRRYLPINSGKYLKINWRGCKQTAGY